MRRPEVQWPAASGGLGSLAGLYLDGDGALAAVSCSMAITFLFPLAHDDAPRCLRSSAPCTLDTALQCDT